MSHWEEMFLRAVLILNGGLLLLAGLLLAVSPEWFFVHLAPFPPFNRHFAGDAGIFSAGFGACLLLAARRPRQNRALVLIGTAASVWHTANHLYDHLRGADGLAHLFSHGRPLLLDLPLFVTAVLLLLALPVLRPR